MTNYNKPPLNFNDQAKLLILRGLHANEYELTSFLSRVNYYRFSGYLYPFRQSGSDKFKSDTSFTAIRSIYNFDARLRFLTFSAIETIDIAILRTQMVEEFACQNGPFCYAKINNFRKDLPKSLHTDMLERINVFVERSNEEFVEQYKEKYTAEIYLPFWMIAEISSFGVLSWIFQNLPPNIQVPIAKKYNLHSRVLVDWLHTLSNIRNICAHHSRLWNRVLPIKPSIPIEKYHPEFYHPTKVDNDKYFIVLAVLSYLLKKITPETSLLQDFSNLLIQYPNIPIEMMGFPLNWCDYQVFK